MSKKLSQPVKDVTLDTSELINFWDFIEYLWELNKKYHPGCEDDNKNKE